MNNFIIGTWVLTYFEIFDISGKSESKLPPYQNVLHSSERNWNKKDSIEQRILPINII